MINSGIYEHSICLILAQLWINVELYSIAKETSFMEVCTMILDKIFGKCLFSKEHGLFQRFSTSVTPVLPLYPEYNVNRKARLLLFEATL